MGGEEGSKWYPCMTEERGNEYIYSGVFKRGILKYSVTLELNLNKN